MPLTLGTNINGLFAQRQLSTTTRALSSTFERLSSGLRINRASDDAAGLALSTNLSTDATVARQGVRNISDAISLFHVAESAIDSLVSIVNRQKELAVQAANGTHTTAQRTAFDTEADALTSEYNRIVQTTSFNGFNLLDGTATSLSVQAGSSNFAVEGANILIPTTVGAGTFQAATTLSTGNRPYSVTSADFNGDGKLDLVSADFSSARLSVFLGNGNGTFGVATTLTTGVAPSHVNFADLNGDGKLDLVSADTNSNRLSVFFGNGNGTFQAATTITTGTDPFSVISADFNGDGKLDLVSEDFGSNRLSVFLGNGNGTFGVATTLTTGSLPHSVISADLNGDGKLDLVSADFGSDRLSVFFGNGNGTFQAATTITTGDQPRSVTSADLNGDGVLDLVSADGFSNRLSVFIQNTTTTGGTSQSALDLTTVIGATAASSYLSEVSNALESARGKVGASLSRLDVTLSNLASTADFLDQARGRIVDIDVAQEAAALVRLQVRQQATTAILAQANLQSQLVLKLLAN